MKPMTIASVFCVIDPHNAVSASTPRWTSGWVGE
jgi:hypothetical protein